MKAYLTTRYGFVLDWDDLPEALREQKIREWIERSGPRPCEACDGQGAADCAACHGEGNVAPDPDDLHQQEEAEEYIRAHFPMYF